MAKVSVIIPCFNQGMFLEEAVNSVRNQSFTDWEIIIVNDGSTDDHTNKLLENYYLPGITIYETGNRGVSAARNYAITKSCGAYILPLDADDTIDKDFLSKTVPLLDRDPSLLLVGTGVQYFGELNATEILPCYSPAQHLLQNLFFNTSLFRRTTFDFIGGYDETFLNGWEDWDLFLRMVNNGSEVHVIPEYLLRYRIKSTSRNADLQSTRKQMAEQQMFFKHVEKYFSVYPEPIQTLRDFEFYKKEVGRFDEYKTRLNNSASYRLGHFILKPLKWIKTKLK